MPIRLSGIWARHGPAGKLSPARRDGVCRIGSMLRALIFIAPSVTILAAGIEAAISGRIATRPTWEHFGFADDLGEVERRRRCSPGRRFPPDDRRRGQRRSCRLAIATKACGRPRFARGARGGAFTMPSGRADNRWAGRMRVSSRGGSVRRRGGISGSCARSPVCIRDPRRACGSGTSRSRPPPDRAAARRAEAGT